MDTKKWSCFFQGEDMLFYLFRYLWLSKNIRVYIGWLLFHEGCYWQNEACSVSVPSCPIEYMFCRISLFFLLLYISMHSLEKYIIAPKHEFGLFYKTACLICSFKQCVCLLMCLLYCLDKERYGINVLCCFSLFQPHLLFILHVYCQMD